MRRLFSIALLIIYTTVICGFTVNMHYCGGKLASVDLSISSEKHPCACGSKAMKKGCCKNKSVHFQYKAEQKVQHFTTVNFNYVVKDLLFGPVILRNLFIPIYLTRNEEVSHAPPFLVSSNPIYLSNRVFRI